MTEAPLPLSTSKREGAFGLVARPLLGLAALGLLVALLARLFRDDLTAFGHAVVDALGLFGMAAGTLIADGLTFPIGPQFYMFVAIAAEEPALPVLAAISAGSMAGAHVALAVSRIASGWGPLRRMIERGPLLSLVGKHGPLAFTVASFLPVPFSLICYACGVLRASYRVFLVVCLIRIPKLALYYAIILAGWGG